MPEQIESLVYLDRLFSPESQLTAAFRKNLGAPTPIYSEEILQGMVRVRVLALGTPLQVFHCQIDIRERDRQLVSGCEKHPPLFLLGPVDASLRHQLLMALSTLSTNSLSAQKLPEHPSFDCTTMDTTILPAVSLQPALKSCAHLALSVARDEEGRG